MRYLIDYTIRGKLIEKEVESDSIHNAIRKATGKDLPVNPMRGYYNLIQHVSRENQEGYWKTVLADIRVWELPSYRQV